MRVGITTARAVVQRWTEGMTMDNKTFAARMREEAERFEDIVLVDKAQFLRIAERIEASPDPIGTAEYVGFSYER